MRTKTGKIVLSIAALVFSGLAAVIGCGLLGGSGWSFGIRFLCGLCFLWPPILVIALISTLFRKEK